jgi:hypothetical protein
MKKHTPHVKPEPQQRITKLRTALIELLEATDQQYGHTLTGNTRFAIAVMNARQVAEIPTEWQND